MDEKRENYSYYVKKLYFADARNDKIDDKWQAIIEELLYKNMAVGIFFGTFEEGYPITFLSDIALENLHFSNKDFWEISKGRLCNLLSLDDSEKFLADNLCDDKEFKVKMFCQDKSTIWVNMRCKVFEQDNGEKNWACSVRVLDNELKEAKIQLDKENKNLKRTLTQQNIDFEDSFSIIQSIYHTIFKLNLTDRTFQTICVFDPKINESTENCKTVREWRSKYINLNMVHEDDVQDFEKFCNVDFLKKSFSEGKEYMGHVYRRLINNQYRHVIMEVVPSKEYTDNNQIVVMYVRELKEDIDKELEKEERLALKETQLSVKKKILLVDDNELQRNILACMLEENYEVIEVDGGKVALEYLKQNRNDIDLMLLDLMMPDMDGFDVLDEMQEDLYLCKVPVIVLTGEIDTNKESEALKRGACDYVTKNCSRRVLEYRIENAIKLYKDSVMLKALRKDSLTGVFNKDYFYLMCEQLLAKYPDEQFDAICSDIEGFKIINEQYGMKMGDDILKYIAEQYHYFDGDKSVYGRIDADSFGLLVVHDEHVFDKMSKKSSLSINDEDLPSGVMPTFVQKFGIYENVDKTLSVSAMFDRATMAVKKIKGQYNVNISKYEDSMRLDMLKNRRILSNMEEAIKDNQFQVWYQPKHDLVTGKLIGAEALVRWIHPKYGFMSPGEFIPLFEQNGFITEMDYYVWEQVCKNQRKWKDENVSIIPISVNISRKDFLTFHERNMILPLVEKYNLMPQEIHLEVTESAYMDNPTFVIEQVNNLHDIGFQIEMDDFGAGYSSLSMFGKMSVDVVKLDMGFIQQKKTEQGDQMMKFIIDMCKSMQLKVTAEGVETEEQAERLRCMGCDYVQGYYYSKPLPLNEFEEYLKKYKIA